MGRKRDTDSLVTDPPDTLAQGQLICKVDSICGNNIYSVVCPPVASTTTDSSLGAPGLKSGSKVLVELPPRFRNTLWIRRGGFVLVDTHDGQEGRRNNKIVGTIAAVIQDVRVWRKMTYWPWPAPVQAQTMPTATGDDRNDADGAEDDLLQANTNRRRFDDEEEE